LSRWCLGASVGRRWKAISVLVHLFRGVLGAFFAAFRLRIQFTAVPSKRLLLTEGLNHGHIAFPILGHDLWPALIRRLLELPVAGAGERHLSLTLAWEGCWKCPLSRPVCLNGISEVARPEMSGLVKNQLRANEGPHEFLIHYTLMPDLLLASTNVLQKAPEDSSRVLRNTLSILQWRTGKSAQDGFRQEWYLNFIEWT